MEALVKMQLAKKITFERWIFCDTFFYGRTAGKKALYALRWYI